jgi:tetratricopeptide (TPR) repeat protein
MASFEEALFSLQTAHFDEAKESFGLLLQKDPENTDLMAGFYAAGYWANRRDQLMNPEPARPGTGLMEAWDQFQEHAEQKGFEASRSIRATMKAVLGKAADQYRQKFQREGMAHPDFSDLEELGKCLIRIQDYENAREILQYARRIQPSRSGILFLLAESHLNMGDQENAERGLGFYRDGFIIQPKEFDPTYAFSHLVQKTIQQLGEEKDNDLDRILLWLPAYLMARSQYAGLRRLHKDEVSQLQRELQRLEKDREQVMDQYREKVEARLCFYYLVLHQAAVFAYNDTEYSRDLLSGLKVLHPGLAEYLRRT